MRMCLLQGGRASALPGPKQDTPNFGNELVCIFESVDSPSVGVVGIQSVWWTALFIHEKCFNEAITVQYTGAAQSPLGFRLRGTPEKDDEIMCPRRRLLGGVNGNALVLDPFANLFVFQHLCKNRLVLA